MQAFIAKITSEGVFCSTEPEPEPDFYTEFGDCGTRHGFDEDDYNKALKEWESKLLRVENAITDNNPNPPIAVIDDGSGHVILADLWEQVEIVLTGEKNCKIVRTH